MSKAIAGIQARMGSTRLPGKSLIELAGKPMLQRVFERVAASKNLDQVVVLTSNSTADDELASFCAQADMPCRRGSEQDVMQRYLDLADEFEPDYIVRITGDCPLVSPEHIDMQIDALRQFDADFCALPTGCSSSVLEGQGVFSARALLTAATSTDARDREHVGSFYFAKSANQYRTVELRVDEVYLRNDLRLAVDELADLQLAQAVFDHFAPAEGSLVPLRKVLFWLDKTPQVRGLNQVVTNSPDTQAAHRGNAEAERRIVGSWPA
ncbi:MAG: spore coat polysaccharide biosynthesis protein SpsF [Planctomycetota bacterium]|jgi:spore coat polysaccharide biosynthesis protein SpsF